MMDLCTGRFTAGSALERGGFAGACAVGRLHLVLRLCFLEGVGVFKEVNQGVNAFACAEYEGSRETWAGFVEDVAGVVV
jgi:hypothetical protein